MAFFFPLHFFFPCPSLELCAVSFVTARSAGLELGRGELFQQTELCWLGEAGLALFCQCSSCSGVICNCAYTQLPSVIKVTQAVNLQDKVYQFHLGEVFLIPDSGDSVRNPDSAVSRSINICWMPVVVAELLRTDWGFSAWELELLTAEYFSLACLEKWRIPKVWAFQMEEVFRELHYSYCSLVNQIFSHGNNKAIWGSLT